MVSITSRAFVGGTIFGVRVSKKTDYRPRRQEAIGWKRSDMLWIAKSSTRHLKCTSIARPLKKPISANRDLLPGISGVGF